MEKNKTKQAIAFFTPNHDHHIRVKARTKPNQLCKLQVREPSHTLHKLHTVKKLILKMPISHRS